MEKEEKIKILTKRFNGDVEKAMKVCEKVETCMEKHKQERYEKMEENTKRINETIAKMIPKEELEDGVVYEVGQEYARCVKKARWNKEKGIFVYKRYKFGHEFEDEMDYFGDVAWGNYAGCAPMKIAEEQVL